MQSYVQYEAKIDTYLNKIKNRKAQSDDVVVVDDALILPIDDKLSFNKHIDT